MKLHYSLKKTSEIEKMVKALKASQCFIMEVDFKDAGTVKAKTKKGETVFSAIQKGNDAPWITGIAKDLFTAI